MPDDGQGDSKVDDKTETKEVVAASDHSDQAVVQEDPNWGEVTEKNPLPRIEDISEKDRLELAKLALKGLFFVFVVVVIYRMVGHLYLSPEACSLGKEDLKETFSSVIQVILPLGTLIIGYYFSSKN